LNELEEKREREGGRKERERGRDGAQDILFDTFVEIHTRSYVPLFKCIL
jgi:hypothetical protein